MKKKSLKKVTSAVLVAAMSMGLLAGCGGSKSSEEAKTDVDGATVIKFGIHVANPKKQETVTYNIVQGFNKENKGKYKVEFVAADTEAHSKNMKLAAQDGSLPEIVHLDSAEAPEYNEAGYLLDMSDFLKENKDIDDALDGMEDAFNDGKVQYGLPYQSNVQGFFYNKDLFDKAGIAYPTDDTTYDEFLDMIAKLKDSGVTPIAIGSKNSGYSMWEFNEFFSRYGWEDNEKSYTGDKAKYSNDDMNACFEKIKGLDFVYLCAERIGVEDVYKQNLEKEYRIGIHGEYAFDYLSKERMNSIAEQDFRNMEEETGSNFGNQVDYWLNYIMGYSITAERIPGTEIVKVSYRKNADGSMDVKPQHVGTGISYISNVIIAALSCKKGSLFVVENPEIHLHPSAQSRLLDFFSFLASKGLQVIIETHSDHIFNGLRKNINSKRIQAEDTSVYFFKQNKELLSTPVKILIDENGVIKNQEKGLFDQFDEDLDELLGL